MILWPSLLTLELANTLLREIGVFARSSAHIIHLKKIVLVDGFWFLKKLPVIIGRCHYIFYKKLWIEFVLSLHVNYFEIGEFQGASCGFVVNYHVVFIVS